MQNVTLKCIFGPNIQFGTNIQRTVYVWYKQWDENICSVPINSEQCLFVTNRQIKMIDYTSAKNEVCDLSTKLKNLDLSR